MEGRNGTLCAELLSRSICNLHVIKSVISTWRDTFKFCPFQTNLCIDFKFDLKICFSRTLECTNHKCQSNCHPGMCESCKLLPSAVDHCPCGKTLLVELTDEKRESCLDPVPTCDNICRKDLPCGPEGMLTF